MEAIIKILTKEEIIVEQINKAKRERVARAFKTNNIDYLKSKDPLFNLVVEAELEEIKAYKLSLPAQSQQRLCWLTIQKKTSTPDDIFVKLCHGLTTLTLTQERPKYCFEATIYNDSDESFNNVHLHYLCLKQVGINKKQYIDRLMKYFKGHSHSVDYKDYELKFYDDKVEYMKGLKWKDQGEKDEITKKYRVKNNLAELYPL